MYLPESSLSKSIPSLLHVTKSTRLGTSRTFPALGAKAATVEVIFLGVWDLLVCYSRPPFVLVGPAERNDHVAELQIHAQYLHDSSLPTRVQTSVTAKVLDSCLCLKTS